MSDLVDFAYEDLLSRIDELLVYSPTSVEDLIEAHIQLQKILDDFGELLSYIKKITSTSED